MRYLIVSDLSLGDDPQGGPFSGADALPALLDDIAPDQLIVNGDGFDFAGGLPLSDEAQASARAEAIIARHPSIFEALAGVPRVVLRPGERDAELAQPGVQAVIRRALGHEVAFSAGDAIDLLVVRGARIVVTHGEHLDPTSRLNRRQPGRGADGVLPGVIEAGRRAARLVRVDAGSPLYDAMWPDHAGAAGAAAFLWPGEATRRARDLILGSGFSVDALSEEVDGEQWLRRFARRDGGRTASGHPSLAPMPAEWAQAQRLRARHPCQAVILGHLRRARLGERRDLAHLNTGSWAPLLSLPGADDPPEVWAACIAALRVDPSMTHAAAAYLKARFAAVLIEPARLGARLSLVEWRDGHRVTLGCVEVWARRAASVRVPARVPDALGYVPLLATEAGVPFGDVAIPGPDTIPVDSPGEPEVERPRDPRATLGPGDDANALADAFWGLVVPRGRSAGRLEALAPLIALRAAQMGGGRPRVLEVDPRAVNDTRTAIRWVEDHYASIEHDERPDYLLLAGDLHEIPHVLHRVLSTQAMVGRLAFTHPDAARTPDLDGYAAYASKVVSYASAAVPRRPALLYYAVDDGTLATEMGVHDLVEPSRAHFDARMRGKPGFDAVRRIVPAAGLGTPRPEDLLDDADVRGGNILVSLGHGLGLSTPGLRRYAEQGALCFGSERIDAPALRASAFLPGGLWINIACFGAGTPSTSDFAPWLSQLPDRRRLLRRVSRALHPVPFVTALPQAALANPSGPLGVVAHVDLTWTQNFDRPTVPESGLRGHARYDALIEKQERLVGREARRFGLSMRALGRAVRRLDTVLMGDVHERHPASSLLWVTQQDLRNYILLGDPAARIGSDPQ